MKKKSCPVGLICINTKTVLFLLILVIILLLILCFTKENKPILNENKTPIISPISVKKERACSKSFLKNDIDNQLNINQDNNIKESESISKEYQNRSNETKIIIQYEPNTKDIHLINKDYERIINPLIPPERRNHYIDPNSYVVREEGVPINIPTRGYTGGVMQIGALYKQDTSDDTMKIGQNNEPVILPLFGMPTYNGSSKWMYYTATDKFNQIKIPITNKNRVCNSEYGCDELYDGDIITIPAYNGEFKVNKYEYDKPRYIPHIL